MKLIPKNYFQALTCNLCCGSFPGVKIAKIASKERIQFKISVLKTLCVFQILLCTNTFGLHQIVLNYIRLLTYCTFWIFHLVYEVLDFMSMKILIKYIIKRSHPLFRCS
ncbi:unnamed protein product [Moneuplotes crassus]|uniref:Uncharacterized protein n=1 Tax=Euplotes crassus TaxID=5936 RepID=A0AAD1Y7I2_EUPCR|nr:unnamed protein product [Moneuplotes crassus]